MLLVVVAIAATLAGVAKGRPITQPGELTGEAAKPPEQIVADAAKSLRAVHSYHFTLSQQYADGRVVTSGDVTASHRAHFLTREGRASTESVVIGPEAYSKPNRETVLAFSRGRFTPEEVDQLSEHWIRLAPPASDELIDFATQMSPKLFAHCLQLHLGTLRTRGLTGSGGQSVVEVDDMGDAPGGAVGFLYFDTHKHVPVRILQNATSAPGGSFDPRCDQTSSPTLFGIEATFRWYDRPLSIKAPIDAHNISAARSRLKAS